MTGEAERCSFAGCPNPVAGPPQVADGAICLCAEHLERWNALQRDVFAEADPKAIPRLLSFWVKAQGGPEGAMRRFLP